MKTNFLFLLIVIFCLSSCNVSNNKTEQTFNNVKVRGWNILSNKVDKGMIAINAADDYHINHLQISHKLIMDLKDVREPKKLRATRKLVKAAKEKGIEKVLIWDHALYELSYYPDKYKNDDGLINLDNPEFWAWLKADQRSMLDSLKNIDGVILTFIETGAYVEDQYSEKWTTESDKLANLVDSIASVIIDERRMELYIRTFIYTKRQLKFLLGCVNRVQHPEVKIMTKETPHDFFLTHPISTFIEEFDKDVIIEFDLGHEYNGQGVIASILPEITVKRWKYYASRENVIGYVARTDRYNNTQNVGRPTEINLYALKRIAEDTSLTAETIVEEFIAKKYGVKLIPNLKKLFLETDDIITSVFYGLGSHMNKHSSLNFENRSIYSRHCSGKWLDNPVVTVGHNVNKTFHYWKDVIEHIAPPRYKSIEVTPGKKSLIYQEAPWVINNGWVSPVEKMNLEYLTYIITEKEYGFRKANWAVDLINEAKPNFSSEEDFDELLQMYERTQLTAELYLHTAKAYYGYRCFLTDDNNSQINAIIRSGLTDMMLACDKIKAYPHKGPSGQYIWISDIVWVKDLRDKIINGWDLYADKKFDLLHR